MAGKYQEGCALGSGASSAGAISTTQEATGEGDPGEILDQLAMLHTDLAQGRAADNKLLA